MENVQSFLQKFGDLASANADVLDKLGKFGIKTFALLKLTGPIGTLLLEGMSGVFIDGSKDLKAIKLLHDTVKKEFDLLSSQVESITQRNDYSQFMFTYSDKIEQGINMVTLYFKWATDDEYKSTNSSIKEQLKIQCNNHNSPIEMITVR
uniref:SERPIN domain-containing protein n=1 Tax=Meloidogyne hapla TaxID=6305 RepID=A0A1I8B671_MELHA